MLHIRSISKAFGGRSILKNLSLSCDEGAQVVIIGESGSGKSTILRILAGLEEQDSGEIELNGKDISAFPPGDRDLGFIFQNGNVYSHLSVRQNLELAISNKNTGNDFISQTSHLMREFGIDHVLDQHASSLSGGENQRLSLVRALLRRPKMLLLDEPFSSLDSTNRRSARAFILKQLNVLGIGSLLVTHDPGDARDWGDQVFFLEAGAIIQTGHWQSLFERPNSTTVMKMLSYFDPIDIEGTIHSKEELLYFQAAKLPLKIPLPPHLIQRFSLRNGDRGSLFYRPEHLPRGQENSASSTTSLSGKIERITGLGVQSFAKINVDSLGIIYAPCSSASKIGTALSVDFLEAGICYWKAK